MIGGVGENATIRRATCFKTTEPIKLFGSTHPINRSTSGNIHFGKYGSLVAFKSTGELPMDENLLKNISQHVIGMNPVKIGVADVDEPCENKEEESCLIHQEYLLDSSITVGELLAENSLEIVAYNRIACGENIQTSEENAKLATASN